MTKIATQTFGLKQELTADLTGTIEKLHTAGFDAIEPYILFSEKQGNNAKNLWAFDTLQIAAEKMRELEMTIPSAHIGVGFGWISMPVSMLVKNILKLHETYPLPENNKRLKFSFLNRLSFRIYSAQPVYN